jgi:hypothetical protein
LTVTFARALIAVSLALVGAAAGCQLDTSLDDRLWPCDPNSPVDQCGTQNGRPMVCWQNFCMPSCDPSQKDSQAGWHCLGPSTATNGVLLAECKPSHDDCTRDTHCLRTDLFYDVGLCLPILVCAEDTDCPGSTKTTCGSTLIKNLQSPGSASDVFTFDHEPCEQVDCTSTSCGEGEACLPANYGDYPTPSLCLATCDSRHECLPNFSCARVGADEGAPNICMPGLPGVRCTRDDDCMAGSCFDTGAGFSVCSYTCVDDSTCEPIDGTATYFHCAGEGDEGTICLATATFHGPDCAVDSECPPETPLCSYYNPYESPAKSGECRAPCASDGSCPARGGLPHLCLANGEGGCYPGEFGLPCTDSSECLSPFTCQTAAPDALANDTNSQPFQICTVGCLDPMTGEPSDQACNDVAQTVNRGYCADDGLCHLHALADEPCTRSAECASGQCLKQKCTGS